MREEMKYGWFSQKAVDAGCRSNIYKTPEGTEVEVTNVTLENKLGDTYQWDDVEAVGPVTTRVRPGQAGPPIKIFKVP